MSIAETIIELRTAKGLSQQELADLTFVSRELVSFILNEVSKNRSFSAGERSSSRHGGSWTAAKLLHSI